MDGVFKNPTLNIKPDNNKKKISWLDNDTKHITKYSQ
jgi:hypothetical protein